MWSCPIAPRCSNLRHKRGRDLLHSLHDSGDGPEQHVHGWKGFGPDLLLIHRRVDRVDPFYTHYHVGKMLFLDTFDQCPLDDDIRVKIV